MQRLEKKKHTNITANRIQKAHLHSASERRAEIDPEKHPVVPSVAVGVVEEVDEDLYFFNVQSLHLGDDESTGC